MSPQFEGILLLVKSALTGERLELPTGFCLEKAAEMAGRHGIEPMVYYGAVNCGFAKGDPIVRALYTKCLRRICQINGQDIQIQKLQNAFCDARIDFMPLKGAILRGMYPNPEMRHMGDADILIRKEQYPRIKPILYQLGYTPLGRTDHEIVWHHPNLRLELHTKPVPERNRGLFDYYGNGWKFARPSGASPYAYIMSPEDTLVFLVAHTAKHYAGGGIGIQHFVDLWIYRRSNPGLEEAYMETELRKLGLKAFYDAALRMLDTWFGQGSADPISQEMTAYIFASGCYGTCAQRALTKAAKSKNGIWSSVFPSYGEMKMRYPILEACPWLLPITWVIRGGDILLRPRGRIGRKARERKLATPENIQSIKNHFESIGLRSNL